MDRLCFEDFLMGDALSQCTPDHYHSILLQGRRHFCWKLKSFKWKKHRSMKWPTVHKIDVSTFRLMGGKIMVRIWTPIQFRKKETQVSKVEKSLSGSSERGSPAAVVG